MLTYKELLERINIAKTKMGDVIKDFQDSDAPQFQGKSAEKRRQMAIAAKLEADRGVKEEVEELDELSTDTLRKYRAKAKDDAYDAADVDDDRRLRKRSMGSWDAGKKILKRGDKLRAEEVDLEEGRMKDLAMDMESLSHADFKKKHKRSKQEMQSSLKSEELKGNQHKIDANKNGKVDGHDFKILRNAKKARYQ